MLVCVKAAGLDRQTHTCSRPALRCFCEEEGPKRKQSLVFFLLIFRLRVFFYSIVIPFPRHLATLLAGTVKLCGEVLFKVTKCVGRVLIIIRILRSV